jgi:hypothetical protein
MDSTAMSVWVALVGGSSTSAGEHKSAAPLGISLQQNYPNPFNPKTTIAFDLSSAGRARLTVFDLLGREVARPVDGWVDAGRHEAVFDGSGCASGMYYYRLTAGRRIAQRSMVLVK